jgi:N-acetylglucosaminyldiphosphoundecaprenol N-acetyl-beta-D-mannosaminyltransferase
MSAILVGERTTHCVAAKMSALANELHVPWVSVGGLPLAVIDRANSAQLMIDVAVARRGGGRSPPIITSANGQVISLCARDARMRALFLSADLIHADGMPLVFASRWKCRPPLPERVATTDLFHDVARLAELRGATFYLLGGKPDVIATAVRKVRERYPRLEVAGFRHGYVGRDETAQIVADINAARPDVLWVGMGVPNEQLFSQRHRAQLTNVGIIKTSGGLFDFLAERNSRAPQWMQTAGLEWLYRLALEPRRLFLRYLITNPHALYLLLTGGSDVRDGTQAAPGSDTPEQARP